jgi:hypothetical protein
MMNHCRWRERCRQEHNQTGPIEGVVLGMLQLRTTRCTPRYHVRERRPAPASDTTTPTNVPRTTTHFQSSIQRWIKPDRRQRHPSDSLIQSSKKQPIADTTTFQSIHRRSSNPRDQLPAPRKDERLNPGAKRCVMND